MEVENVSKKIVVLADTTKYYATLGPGQCVSLDDSLMNVECIYRPIVNGLLKIIKRDMEKPTQKTTKKSDEAIAALSGEAAIINDNETISGVRGGPDAVPFVPQKSMISPVMVNEGQILTKRGRKKVLTTVVKAGKPKVKVIKMVGNGGDAPALDSGDTGTLIVNESGLPGQARQVSINEIGEENLEQIRKMTDNVLEEAGRQKKISMYVSGPQDVREKFITNSTDTNFLKEVAKMEWGSPLASMVREKLAALGVTDE